MNEIQNQLRVRILAAIKHLDSERSITYCSEWLGYLPFGLYHWIEHNGTELKDLPSGWSKEDIHVLEEDGFLRRQNFWQNPKDEYHQKTVYLVETT